MKPLAFLAFALALHAQSTIGAAASSTTVAPGGTLSFSVTQAAGTSAGDQWTISAPAFVTALTGTIAPALATLGKSLTCDPYSITTHSMPCIAVGPNQALIPAGPLATFTASISATASGAGQLAINAPSAADPNSVNIPTTPGPSVTITVQASRSKCDLLGTGATDPTSLLQDLQLEVNWLLSNPAPPSGQTADRNGDGVLNAADAQIMADYAASGGATCLATQ